MIRLGLGAALVAVVLSVAVPWACAFAGVGRGTFALLRPASWPAVGLGGDPFLSPLDDQTGWWAGLERKDSPGTRIGYDESDPIGGWSGGRATDDDLSCVVAGGGSIGNVEWNGGSRVHRPRWNGSWGGSGGGLGLARSASRVEWGLRTEVAQAFVLRGAGLLWDDRASSGSGGRGVGARYRRGTLLTLQGSWEQSSLPDTVAVELYGQPVAASLNLEVEDRRLDVRLEPAPGLAAEGSVSLSRHRSIRESSPAAAYELRPHGRVSGERVSLYCGRRDGTRLVARWVRSGADLGAVASWAGQRFGGLDYARIDLWAHLLGVEHRQAHGTRFLLELERSWLQGASRGKLESWPFSSTAQDLLGLSRTYRAEGRVHWRRWHAGMEKPWGPSARVQAGIEWMDLFPRGQLESWRPVFLAFGRTDERLERLAIRRLQLAVVSAGGEYEVGRFKAGFGLEQVVLARSHEEAEEKAGPGEEPQRRDMGSGGRWPSGTMLRVHLARRF